MSGLTKDRSSSAECRRVCKTLQPPRAEVINRLRILKEPATLFGETDSARWSRLSTSERDDDPWLVQLLRRDGFVGPLIGIVSGQTCAALLREVLALEAAIAKSAALRTFLLSHYISKPELRHDIRLPLSQQTVHALQEAASAIHPTVSRVLGPDCFLVELGAVTAWPGALRQGVHQDVDTTGCYADHGHAPILTIFIALEDVTETMGPTEIFKATHTPDVAHSVAKLLRSGGSNTDYDLIFQWLPDQMILSQGDAVIMDTHVFHCGGVNNSSNSRSLLHFSFMSASGEPPDGFTYHYLPVERLSFNEILTCTHEELVSKGMLSKTALPCESSDVNQLVGAYFHSA